MDISLIVPCFNEEGNVELFFNEAQNVFKNSGYTCEYVFVNDGSTDLTRAKLKSIYDSNPDDNVTVINFSRNFGKESAIFAGLKNATGDYICIIDADLQQRPETALKMYKILENNPQLDCVCAYQNSRKEGKLTSGLKSAFYKLINKISETQFENGASDFRFFKSKVKDAILQLGEYHRFSKGIFSWVGFNVHYMEYEADERNSGESKWSLFKLFKYAVSGIVAFSTAPLKLAAILGSASVGFSVIYLIVTLVRKLVGDIDVSGFTQIIMLITFFGGVILVILGIIGEYIAKIYQQVKNRPIYIIDEILKK